MPNAPAISLVPSQTAAACEKKQRLGEILRKSYSVSGSGEVREIDRDFQNRRTQREFEARQRL